MRRLLALAAFLCFSACSGAGVSPIATTRSTAAGAPNAASAQSLSPFDSANGSFIGASGTANIYVPGPDSAYDAAQPFYHCSTNFYVSTSGRDSNSGTNPSTPWLTIAHAAAQPLGAGSCINISPGTYRQSSTVIIDHGGNAASPNGYEAWRCTSMPFSFSGGQFRGEGSGCVISANTAVSALFQVGAPYVIFDGIEADGNRWNAQRGFTFYAPPPPAPGPHHLWVLNSDVHHFGEAGFSLNSRDWIFVLHDVWHDNAVCSANATTSTCPKIAGDYGSGLTIGFPDTLGGYVPTAADQQFCASAPFSACYHIVIASNVAYHNYNFQGGSLTNTDGNGIIFDTWSGHPYAGAGLIMSNVVYDNGGNGIEVNGIPATSQVAIVNNTAFDDAWDTRRSANDRGEISVQKASNNVTTLNNIAYAVGSSGILASNSPFVSIGALGIGDSWIANLSYPCCRNHLQAGYSYPTTGANRNSDGVNPKFRFVTPGATVNDFGLQAGSPALGFVHAFSLRNQAGTVDAGACQLGYCP